MPIRGVLFDAGNTLVYIHPERMVDIYRAEGVDIDTPRFQSAELEARRALHETIDEGSNGTEPELWREYFIRLMTLSGVPPAAMTRVAQRVREEHEADHLWTHALPGTGPVLGSLREAGFRVGVISNADGRMEGALVTAGLRDALEVVIDSAAAGMEKPDPAIFRAGAEALDLPPEACVYIGDLFPVDYLGALGAGMRALLLDPLGLHSARARTIGALAELHAALDA